MPIEYVLHAHMLNTYIITSVPVRRLVNDLKAPFIKYDIFFIFHPPPIPSIPIQIPIF